MPGRAEDCDDPESEFSSPACLMHEASDLYMGFASRDEVLDVMARLRERPADAVRQELTARLQQLLPRIRDSRLRAEVEALLAEFP